MALKLELLSKVPSGVRGLDVITNGGLPKTRPILLAGRTGCGKTLLAIPTLVRKLPEPIRKLIGDWSNTERVLVGLDLQKRGG